MKHLYRLLALLLALLLATPALADVITIDLETATYDELTAAYELLKAERIARLTAAYAATHEAQPVEGIAFRNVPWGSTRVEAEAILGKPERTDDYYPIYATWGSSDGRGFSSYYTWKIAGYDARGMTSFVYVVQDGSLLRDKDLAIMTEAMYTIQNISDKEAAMEDLTTKLTSLYGACTYNGDARVWTDANGHRIELGASTFVTIRYFHAEQKSLMNAALQAIAAEKAAQEELQRLQNQNSTDGL